jgi:transposase
VNKQNFRYWAAEKTREPYFFEEAGVIVTVNANRYCDMLENFLRPKIDEYGDEHNLEDFWFQQDGATTHTARRPRAILKEVFPGRMVSLHEAVPWPPHSPDLSPCDFFFVGVPQGRGFQTSSSDQLKEANEEEIDGISPDMLVRGMENFQERLQNFIGRQGHPLDDIIFKTNVKRLFYIYIWEIKSVW